MGKAHYIIPIFVPHEGCPHNCVFCNQNRITGADDKVNAEYVKETIEEYLSTIPNKDAVIEVSFFGGTFTAIDINKQKELLEVARNYKKKNKVKYIRLSTRPDYIDDNILTNLKNYSVDIIELGVQSLDDEVLLKSGRGHSEKDVIDASKLIKNYGFVLGHQIMLGLPGDNFKKDIETTKKVISMKPDICRIYPALVIKDTPMELMFNKGTYKPYDLKECVDISKVIFGMLSSNGIEVIRIGLQPTEEINVNGSLIAGPFHPAFRELVEGSIMNDMILDILEDKKFKKVTIYINPKDVSKLYSNRKFFFSNMRSKLNCLEFKVIQDINVKKDNIKVFTDGIWNKLSKNTFLKVKYKEGK
ncbi:MULTISPECIES: elongator complex protein 3 [Clostridium]|uniref:elongator complex protein 3 n=1 Tax=Clostridium TaxID=1485 RepID=UPI0008266895|nr:MULTISPECIES: radical SAM protein [Clostridium]PJI06618.1 radical SAM protein [Clostridium sp. CT7]